MPNGTIFFSYSRADQDFVLELAKKLRKIGADIWIDQLDIQAGRNWDKSVERALESSDSVLVVLSKSSVESVNVMDEVSIAIEEGKNVIPLLYEDCKRPFRLKRRHYVDFTKDKDKAFEILVATLELNKGHQKDGIVEIAQPKDPVETEKKSIEKVEAEEPEKKDAKPKHVVKEDKVEKKLEPQNKPSDSNKLKTDQEAEAQRLKKLAEDKLIKEQEIEKTRLKEEEEKRNATKREEEKLKSEKQAKEERLKREAAIKEAARKEAEQKYKEKEKKSKSTLIIIIVAALVAIGATVGWFLTNSNDKGIDEPPTVVSEESQEEKTPKQPVAVEKAVVEKTTDLDGDDMAYDSIKDQTDFYVFEAHIIAIDSCKHLIEIDNRFWTMAEDTAEIYSYKNYLEHFPNGENTEVASQKIKAIEDEIAAVKKDSIAWVKAKSKNNLTALLNYSLNDSLKGAYKTEADEMISTIGKKGWLFVGRTSGENKMESENNIFELVCCDSSEAAKTKVPDVNEIIKFNSQRKLYADVPKKGDQPNGHVNRGKLTKVIQVKNTGSVVYLQILY